MILGFASARESRDNQDDILAFLGNNFEFALLVLTYTHKSLELYRLLYIPFNRQQFLKQVYMGT